MWRNYSALVSLGGVALVSARFVLLALRLSCPDAGGPFPVKCSVCL